MWLLCAVVARYTSGLRPVQQVGCLGWLNVNGMCSAEQQGVNTPKCSSSCIKILGCQQRDSVFTVLFSALIQRLLRQKHTVCKCAGCSSAAADRKGLPVVFQVDSSVSMFSRRAGTRGCVWICWRAKAWMPSTSSATKPQL